MWKAPFSKKEWVFPTYESSWACAVPPDSCQCCMLSAFARNNLNWILYTIIAFENVDFTPPHTMLCPLSNHPSIQFSQLETFYLRLSILSLSPLSSLHIYFSKKAEAPVMFASCALKVEVKSLLSYQKLNKFISLWFE